MPNGIIIIDKSEGWTASGCGLAERGTTDVMPLILAADPSFSRRTRFAGLRRDNLPEE